MRISDWSSDVCSSDLLVIEIGCVDLADRARNVPGLRIPADMIADLEIVAHGTSFRTDQHVCSARVPHACQPRVERFPQLRACAAADAHPDMRSEERRVGKEGVSPCRSRWWP